MCHDLDIFTGKKEKILRKSIAFCSVIRGYSFFVVKLIKKWWRTVTNGIFKLSWIALHLETLLVYCVPFNLFLCLKFTFMKPKTIKYSMSYYYSCQQSVFRKNIEWTEIVSGNIFFPLSFRQPNAGSHSSGRSQKPQIITSHAVRRTAAVISGQFIK